MARIFLRYKISMDIIRRWEVNRQYPSADLILDQGPVFNLALARKENLFDLAVSEGDVSQVRLCIQFVYKMNASVDVLSRRVRERPQQLGRGRFLTDVEFAQFCAEYDEAFKVLNDLGIPSSEVNTGNVTPAEVLQHFNDTVKNG